MKRLFTLATMVLVLTSAKADVVINATNFPDENFRAEVADNFDSDGDGIISDEEMEANGGHLTFDRVSNLKGIELLTSITELYLVNYPDEPSLKTFDYALPNLSTLDIQDQVGELTTVDASKCTNLETFLAGENPANLSTLKLPSGIKSIALNNAPLIKTFDPKQFSDLRSVAFTGTTGITDLDFSDHKSIQTIGVDGIHDYYQLNSLIMANCPMLTNIDIKSSTIKSLTFKSLPEVLSILVDDSDITNMLVDDLVQLGSIEALDNVLGTLTLNNLPTIYGLDCHNNKLQTLIIDKCPNMNGIWAEHNKLMWLDLQDVKKNETDENSLKIDDQRPSAVAYKLSPTEVGLLVHERFDVERVLKLVANNKNVTPAWAEYDGVKYFVFSNEGTNADALKGEKTSYQYETRWPYAWMDGNSEDNNLPVTLNVTKVEKLPSWIKLSSTETLKGKVDGTLTPPEVSRSDKYDGKLTWTSSDESVVMVDAETGALSIIGAGTATITVSGAETDYRTAPAMVTYTVSIETGETCDITIGKNGKTTFCGDKSLDFSYSDEVKAFIATGFDKSEGTIWMTRVKDVPAGVPVMIKGTAEETYHVPVTEGGSSYYKNMFVGNTTGESMSIGETSEDGKYVNYYMSGGQFKSVKTSANIGANKCYLQLPANFAAEATGEGYQVKIAASGKSSFAAPYDLDFTSLDDDVKAFTATGYDASTKTIWLTRVRKVQKGEGLLLKGTGGETYTIPSSGVQAAYGNMIVGNIGDEITINGTSEDGTLTNYYLKGGTYMSVSGSANIGTNKSYLQLPTSMLAGTTGARSEDALSSSDVLGDLGTQENLGYLGNLGMPSTCHLAELETESMPIILGETTGIETVQTTPDPSYLRRGDEWYDLQGRRINGQPTRKGIYVVNGKKVMR